MSADGLLRQALGAARETRFAAVEPGARHAAGSAFREVFGAARALVVADGNTFRAAGRDVGESLRREGVPCDEPFIFGPHVYAEWACVEELEARLASCDAIPVAVGSGTLNDLAKLTAHHLGRPYMVVATAASMDGYTAFGASITRNGSKQTFECPAPRAVVADLETIAGAPPGMNASGYADLLAKCPAGADWMLAEAAGVEAVDESAWNIVQGPLRSFLDNPAGVARNEPAALRNLVCGLLMGGFAMQAHRSSRPASGAEHQFSHLWDMQHHQHGGAAPSHGFKVGIGSLASLALYEDLLARDLAALDPDACARRWPSLETLEARAAALFGAGDLAAVALREVRAKYADAGAVRDQLDRVRAAWPDLRARLVRHLLPPAEARAMLRAVGCPAEPEEIGISRERLRLAFEQAGFIRRRFTVLDLAARGGFLAGALDRLFGAGGPWPLSPATQGAGS